MGKTESAKGLRRVLNRFVRKLAEFCGSRLRDRHGKVLGRAFVFSWGGRISVVGVSPDCVLRPCPLPQTELRYGRQSLCWEKAPVPDFPRMGKETVERLPVKVCHALISHLDGDSNGRMISEWKRLDPDSPVLLLHGGPQEAFDRMAPGVDAIHISDPALRTRDHAREKQEYLGLLRAIAGWLDDHPEVTHVHLAEYDVVPVTKRLGDKLVACLRSENADLIAAGVQDFTGGVHPHYLYLLGDEGSLHYIQSLSCREERRRILSMLGCTSLWTVECLREVASLNPPERIYLELSCPTLAHHLGWRVRPLSAEQQLSLKYQGNLTDQIPEYAGKGAWMVHPCKSRWQEPSPQG